MGCVGCGGEAEVGSDAARHLIGTLQRPHQVPPPQAPSPPRGSRRVLRTCEDLRVFMIVTLRLSTCLPELTNIFNHIYLEFLKIKRVKHHTELSIKCVLSRALCDITRVLAAPIRCVMCLPHLCDGHFLNLLCAFSIRFRKRLYVHIHAHHEQHATGFRVLFSACKQRSHTLPIAPHLPFHPPLGTGWAQLSLQHLCPVRG